MKYQLIVILATAFFMKSTAFAHQHGPATSDDKDFQAYMQQMQEHMKTMHEQMQKIQQATDPQERQKLMQEHWQSMQAGMSMMQGSDSMPGCMMNQTPGMGQGHMMGKGHMMGQGHMMGEGHMMGPWWNRGDKTKQAPDQRMQIMGTCMGMQQQMMNQMMMHINPGEANN